VGKVEACDQGFLIRERAERMWVSAAGIEQGKAYGGGGGGGAGGGGLKLRTRAKRWFKLCLY